MSSLNKTKGESVFAEIYVADWSFGLAIAASVLNILVVTPLLFLIPWYEKYGSNHQRTLINQVTF
jgi:hypothetical protein